MKTKSSLWAFVLLSTTCLAQPTKTQNDAVVPVSRSTKGWMARHESFLKNAKEVPCDVLFVGDSITQGWGGSGLTTWNSLRDWKPFNLGIGGDRTQHVLWRITEGKELEHLQPKVIVLMIGTNNISTNSADQIAQGIKKIIAEFTKQKPKAKVLLLGVFPRAGKRPSDVNAKMVPAKDLQPKVKAINDLIAKFDDGKTVHYLDIGKKFLDEKGNLHAKIMPDYLHLSDEGYKIWAEAIKEHVNVFLK